MDKDIALAIEMAIGSQSDFDMRLIMVLISMTKALPEESRAAVASQMMELIEEHREGLKDISNLHRALHKESADGK
jgi:hypothetical protein